MTDGDGDDAGDNEDRGMFFTAGFNGSTQQLAACVWQACVFAPDATEANILIRALGMGRSYQDQIDDKDVTLLARMRFQ